MHQQPWYKQFWPWFLIALPSCVVCASIYTLFLATQSPFSMVSEDYYKKGKAINQDLSRTRLAQNMGLVFSMDAVDNEITLRQQGGPQPDGAIRVSFQHATLADKDFSQLVTRNGKGQYQISVTDPIAGRWRVDIESFDGRWRLHNKLTLPTNARIWFN